MDWKLIACYGGPIVTLFIGAALNRYLEKRPRLVSYLAHGGAVQLRPPQGQAVQVNVHSIVVRNAGRKAASNVRLGHAVLPDFSVYPAIGHTVVDLPGGREILFPTLVPQEQIVINYLYLPPLIWSGVNTYVKSDEGFAKIVTVVPTRQWSLAAQRWFLLLLAIGAACTIAILVQGIRYVIHVTGGG